jgi:hypothetical protein
VLSLAMSTSAQETGRPPEMEIVRRREMARKRSMQKAGVAACLGIAAMAFLVGRKA